MVSWSLELAERLEADPNRTKLCTPITENEISMLQASQFGFLLAGRRSFSCHPDENAVTSRLCDFHLISNRVSGLQISAGAHLV